MPRVRLLDERGRLPALRRGYGRLTRSTPTSAGAVWSAAPAGEEKEMGIPLITVKLMRKALENLRDEDTIFFLTEERSYTVDYVHLDLLNNRVDLTSSERDR